MLFIGSAVPALVHGTKSCDSSLFISFGCHFDVVLSFFSGNYALCWSRNTSAWWLLPQRLFQDCKLTHGSRDVLLLT